MAWGRSISPPPDRKPGSAVGTWSHRSAGQARVRRMEGGCCFSLAELWLPQAPPPVLFPTSPNTADRLTAHANFQTEKGKPICPDDTLRTGFGRGSQWGSHSPAPRRAVLGRPLAQPLPGSQPHRHLTRWGGLTWAEIHQLPVVRTRARRRTWGEPCRLFDKREFLLKVTPEASERGGRCFEMLHSRCCLLNWLALIKDVRF